MTGLFPMVMLLQGPSDFPPESQRFSAKLQAEQAQRLPRG